MRASPEIREREREWGGGMGCGGKGSRGQLANMTV